MERKQFEDRDNHLAFSSIQSVPFRQSEETHNTSPSSEIAPQPRLEGEITHLLRNVLRELDEHLQSLYEKSDLNEARIEILKALSIAHPTGCTQVDLAHNLGQSEANISAMVARMRRDGWIYRLRSQSDRRKSNLLLTSKSLQILDDVQSAASTLLKQLFSGLSQEECTQLSLILGKLHVSLSIPQQPVSSPVLMQTAENEPQNPAC